MHSHAKRQPSIASLHQLKNEQSKVIKDCTGSTQQTRKGDNQKKVPSKEISKREISKESDLPGYRLAFHGPITGRSILNDQALKTFAYGHTLENMSDPIRTR